MVKPVYNIKEKEIVAKHSLRKEYFVSPRNRKGKRDGEVGSDEEKG